LAFTKRSLFITNIHQFANPNAERDNDNWRKAIYELRERDKGRVGSNHLGWQSTVPLRTVPKLTSLARFIMNCLDEVGRDEGVALDRFGFVVDGWANINGQGALNNFHNHPNTLLSGCYYIDTPANGGDIVFRDPRELAYVFQPPYATGPRAPVTGITPEPGMLIIFPAWLVHAVGSNMATTDRMSVAFNANVEPKRS
jgi:uncharacterized protein (TIGR02466 family)